MECDNTRNAQYRQDNPEIMKEWKKNNPGYASKKYHETKEVRKHQNKEWYENNKDQALQKHKDWYYDPSNQDSIKESRKQWYASNPNYDKNYYYNNHEHFLNNLLPKQRERYYTKRRQQIQEKFQELAINTKLPNNPTEHDFKYWLAGEIIKRTGWFVFKEVFIDDDNTSRIDLLIPEQQIGIELKINNMYGNTNKSNEQVNRYQLHLPDYNILLVSLDGSIGVSVDELFEQLIP